MRAVHQVLVAAAFGDAITNEALGIRQAIKRRFPGIESEIYAYHRGQGVEPIRSLSEYPPGEDAERALVFHSSIGEPGMVDFLAQRRERMVLRYHNITPAAWFEPYDSAFAALLRLGREQLTGLRDRSLLAIADSSFNQSELVSAGFAHTAVVPVHADLAALLGATPAPPRRMPVPRSTSEPVVLFVGRVAPNKGHVSLLQAFHVLKTYRCFDARLWIVGGNAQARYSWELEQYRRELGLIDAYFAGTVSSAELAFVYRRADVLLCLSQHEGFCVPLVEAMAFDIPIVALARTAVPETLGGAGLLLNDPNPAIVAEAVAGVIGDASLRRTLVNRGRRRLAELKPQESPNLFAAELARVLK